MGRDGCTGLVVLATSLFLFWSTLGLEKHPMVPVGPAFYPQIVLGVTAALALCLVIADLAARRRVAEVKVESTRSNHALVLLAFGIVAAYVVLLPYLGFRVATLAFLLAMPIALERPSGPRRWVAVFVLAFAATAVAYLAFEQYLQVLLPRGRWTDW